MTDELAAAIEAAYACDRAGDERGAIRHYDRAWALGILDHLPARAGEAQRRAFVVGYGSTLRNVGRADEAVAILAEAAAADPDHAPYRAFLALALLDAGHPRAAVATMLGVALDVARPAALDGYERALNGYFQALLDAAPTR